MTSIPFLLPESIAYALGWCLVHSLWQGLLVACGLACALTWVRRCARGSLARAWSANMCYLISFAALLLMLALPVVTAFLSPHSMPVHRTPAQLQAVDVRGEPAPSVIETAVVSPQNAADTPSSRPVHLTYWKARIAAFLEPSLPWAVFLWLAGVSVLALWNFGGWIQARRLTVRDVGDVPEPWRGTLRQLCRQLNVTRPVRVLTSCRVTTAMVAGWFQPVILLPVSVLTGLTPGQVRAVLAHEVAHVRRHDYAANLLQTAIVTLLFYHPAVWWVSRRIRVEREHCCDDLAVGACGDPLLVARALTALEVLRGAPAALAMAASGGVLLSRVRRIVGAPEPSAQRAAPALAGALLFALILSAALGFPSVRAEAPAPASDKAELTEGVEVPAPASDKAELMGRVEDFFLHNYRDITARKSLEWGEVERHEDGNRSIRYLYNATIWDKDKKVMNQVFTFDPKGACVSVEDVPGYPKEVEKKKWDTTTKQGMIELVEYFFSKNFVDVTARETIEWGEVEKQENGNVSIRYKYNATIWDKDKKVMDQVFTFDPAGNFVSVKDVAAPSNDAPAAFLSDAKLDLTTPETVVIGFTKAAAAGDAKQAQAYFLPGGVDYEDILEVLSAKPSDSGYPFRVMMESVDPEAPVLLISKEETDDCVKVVWRATFRKGFDIEGQTFKAGSTYDFDATLKKTDHGWLIDNF